MKADKQQLFEIILPCLNLILVFISIVVPIGLAIYSNHIKSKNLEAYLISRQYLKNPDFPKDLKVELSCLDQIVFLNLRFINHGNTINSKDITAPITIKLKNIDEILFAKIIDSDDVGIRCKAKFSKNQVEISRALINHNDSFSVHIYCKIPSVSNEYVDSIGGRIVDLHKISYHPRSPGAANKKLLLIYLIILILFLLVYNLIWRLMEKSDPNLKLSTRIVMIIGLFVLISIILGDLILLLNLN